MVLRVVLRVTSQCSQPWRCSCRSARIAVEASSIISSSRARNSVQVISLPLSPVGGGRFCRGTSGFPFEVTAEPLAKLEPRAQAAGFHGRNAEAQWLCRVLGGESLYIAQFEHDAEAGGQALDGLLQDFLEFGLGIIG